MRKKKIPTSESACMEAKKQRHDALACVVFAGTEAMKKGQEKGKLENSLSFLSFRDLETKHYFFSKKLLV